MGKWNFTHSKVVYILVRTASFPRFWRNRPWCRKKIYLMNGLLVFIEIRQFFHEFFFELVLELVELIDAKSRGAAQCTAWTVNDVLVDPHRFLFQSIHTISTAVKMVWIDWSKKWCGSIRTSLTVHAVHWLASLETNFNALGQCAFNLKIWGFLLF